MSEPTEEDLRVAKEIVSKLYVEPEQQEWATVIVVYALAQQREKLVGTCSHCEHGYCPTCAVTCCQCATSVGIGDRSHNEMPGW